MRLGGHLSFLLAFELTTEVRETVHEDGGRVVRHTHEECYDDGGGIAPRVLRVRTITLRLLPRTSGFFNGLI